MDDVTVTHSRSGMPNWMGLASTFQTRSVKKFAEFARSEGMACATRKNAIAAMSTTTNAPEPIENPLKMRSPRRLAPASAKSPDGSASISDRPVIVVMRLSSALSSGPLAGPCDADALPVSRASASG